RRVLARTAQSLPGAEEALTGYVTELLANAQNGKAGCIYTRAIENVERELFGQAINLAHGNQAKAARWLGVSRLTMREKLNRFGLHPSQDKTASGQW
ncbi:MAG: hypothetical protein DME22_12265, partial [Verrucomicrobia bacterium]